MCLVRPMNAVAVADLSPGEAVLSERDVARHCATLAAGEPLESVAVIEIDGHMVVRDGNNRVRAYVEHCRARGQDPGTIPCVPSTARPPGPAALDGLRKMARYYGTGPDAFAAMPVASPDQYETMQTEVARKIYREAN